MKGNQTEDDTTTNLSLFCEKKEDFLALISDESKLNFACYIDICACVHVYYDYIYIFFFVNVCDFLLSLMIYHF